MKEQVGTELTALIPDWAVQFKGGCGCRDVAKKMDKWGLRGCELHRKYIVNHLMKQSDKLIPILRGLPEALRRAVATRLLNKAMRNARKAAEQ